jgi:hypothetical protein
MVENWGGEKKLYFEKISLAFKVEPILNEDLMVRQAHQQTSKI